MIQQVTFAVSMPNVWGTIDKLVTESLQPWASRAFCASASEGNGWKVHLHIVFSSWVIRNLKESQVNMRVVLFLLMWVNSVQVEVGWSPPPIQGSSCDVWATIQQLTDMRTMLIMHARIVFEWFPQKCRFFSPVPGAGVMFENTEVVIEESATEEEEVDDDMPEKVGSPYSPLCCCCYIATNWKHCSSFPLFEISLSLVSRRQGHSHSSPLAGQCPHPSLHWLPHRQTRRHLWNCIWKHLFKVSLCELHISLLLLETQQVDLLNRTLVYLQCSYNSML